MRSSYSACTAYWILRLLVPHSIPDPPNDNTVYAHYILQMALLLTAILNHQSNLKNDDIPSSSTTRVKIKYAIMHSHYLLCTNKIPSLFFLLYALLV